jgi:ornithine cyclodeaminase/alanine dehydrogenase
MLLIPERLVAELLSPAAARDVVLAALGMPPADAGLSDPRSLFLRPARRAPTYHLKAGWVARERTAVAGFRLASFPRGKTAQRFAAVLLTELDTSVPIALVAAETLSMLRVGAAIGVAVERLGPHPARRLGLIGTGRLARAALRGLRAPGQAERLGAVRAVSRSPEHRRRFVEDMALEGIAVEAVDTPAMACDGADVIITVTNADEVLVRATWCQPGSLLVTAGGRRECEDEAILGADKIFVDDWEQCTILGDIAALHRRGKIRREDVAGTFGDVVAGRAAGRTAGGERIVAVPQGLATLDAALARFVYEHAAAAGLGVQVDWP